MSKRTDNDAELFLEAMKDVRPLQPHNLADRKSPERHRTGAKAAGLAGVNTRDEEDSGFTRSGIQRNVLRKLRNGQIPIEDELDLHGYSSVEAENELRTFLWSARASGRQRAVRVIHGKGHGSPEGRSLLKQMVADLLRRSGAVLAFCVAGPMDGGAGAVHVLLRKR